MNPDSFTFYELSVMYEERERDNWNYQASQMQLLQNCIGAFGRDSKKFSVEDFHPLMERKKQQVSGDVQLGLLKKQFGANK